MSGLDFGGGRCSGESAFRFPGFFVLCLAFLVRCRCDRLSFHLIGPELFVDINLVVEIGKMVFYFNLHLVSVVLLERLWQILVLSVSCWHSSFAGRIGFSCGE